MQSYRNTTPPRRTRANVSVALWIVLSLAGIGSYYVISQLNESSDEYLQAQHELQKTVYSGSVEVVTLPNTDKRINVPSWTLFQTGNIWALVSKAKPLPENYTPTDLVESPLAHGDASTKMQVSAEIVEPLKALAAAAEADGHTLVLSSAYRSIADQQKLKDDFTATKGAALAKQYVAEPGSSEHHTGLAVDLSDASGACSLDSDSCSLSSSSAQWLADNAYKYGFIQRYPNGSQSITGISYEPWHYRYVGKVLARAMHDSNLTFDQFVQLVR